MHKESRLLRIGVLGAGPMAQAAHFDACRKARNAELYAICDASPVLLNKMAAIHEPRTTYADYDAMLSDPEVEAVLVVTADQFHVPLCLKAIEAGKHVLVEKPLGVCVEECETLRERLAGSGLVLQVGNNRRFDPGWTAARRFIAEEIGPLLSIKAWYYDSLYRYTMTDNLQPLPVTDATVRRPAGNPKADKQRYFMLGHGSHLLDTVRFLGGDIVGVQARLLERFDAYCWFMSLDLADGALGHADMALPIRGDFEEGFQVQGEHGSVKGRGYLPWYFKSSEVECFAARDRQFHRPLGEDAYSYRRQIEGFAATILDGAPQHGAGIDDGVAAMRAMVAAARSVETGQVVRLADVHGGV